MEIPEKLKELNKLARMYDEGLITGDNHLLLVTQLINENGLYQN